MCAVHGRGHVSCKAYGHEENYYRSQVIEGSYFYRGSSFRHQRKFMSTLYHFSLDFPIPSPTLPLYLTFTWATAFLVEIPISKLAEVSMA